MKHILIHGLGQGASSWDGVTSFLEETIDIECPELFALPDGRDVTYANLYRAFSDRYENYTDPLCPCGHYIQLQGWYKDRLTQGNRSIGRGFEFIIVRRTNPLKLGFKLQGVKCH